MRLSLSEIATISLFSALAYAGGYLLIAVPNIEIFTAIVFISGVFLGSRNGAIVGVIAQTLYSIFNPYGMSPLPLMLAQIMNRALVGWFGGWVGQKNVTGESTLKIAIQFGAAGLFLTLLYDLMAFLSFQWMSGFSFQQMQASFAMGVPFYLIHSLGNTAIFALAVPVVLKTIHKTSGLKKVNVH